MTAIQNTLQTLGFTKNEAIIYASLTKLGPSTSGPLIEESGLYRVIVYDTLQKLKVQDLVKVSIRKNRQIFEAASPDRIREIIREKEKLADKVVEELNLIKAQEQIFLGATIYEGWQGISDAQEKYLLRMKSQREGTYMMVGATYGLHIKLDEFFNKFHAQRAKLNISAELLFNNDCAEFAFSKKKYPPVNIRILPKEVLTPSWISTYADMTLIGVADSTPLAFLIVNPAVAASYQQFFRLLWKQGKPINR